MNIPTSYTFTPVVPPLPLSDMQLAYLRGKDPMLPLGGFECVGLFEFLSNTPIDSNKLQIAIDTVHENICLHSIFTEEGMIPTAIESPKITVHSVQDQFCEELHEIRDSLLATINMTRGPIWTVHQTNCENGFYITHIAISLAAVDLPGIGALLEQISKIMDGKEIEHITQWEDIQTLERPYIRDKITPTEKISLERTDIIFSPPKIGSLSTERTDITRLCHEFSYEQWKQLEMWAEKCERSTAALTLTIYEDILSLYSGSEEFITTFTSVNSKENEHWICDRTQTYLHRAQPNNYKDFVSRVQYVGDEIRYRISRGIFATEELQMARAANQDHPGISPFAFTSNIKKPLFSNTVITIFGKPTIFAITPQTLIDCRIVRLSSEIVECTFDVRIDSIPLNLAKDIFDLFISRLSILINSSNDKNIDIDKKLTSLCEKQSCVREKLNSTPRINDGELLYSKFITHLALNPEATAIIDSKEIITYEELHFRALALASYLHSQYAPQNVIAIRLPKGPEQIIAVLAVLYAGCTYLPLGIDIPDNRIQTIMNQSQACSIITAETFHKQEIYTDSNNTQLTGPIDIPYNSLAYIIYTSGSTGKPKGVAIEHCSAMNTISDVNSRLGINSQDKILAVSALDFDLSVYDIFGALSAGASIVTIAETQRKDAFAWAELIQKHQITLFNSAPGLSEMLLIAAKDLISLKYILCSGDWISTNLWQQIHIKAPYAVLLAMGGATEASIWSNYYLIKSDNDIDPSWHFIPYGYPLNGQKYRVINNLGLDCPNNIVGELWIGGTGLAREYFLDSQRTAQQFIVDENNNRWYKTGDMGYWSSEGILYFCGRVDSQVKIKGHRIECKEIEAIMRTHPAISSAIVLPIQDNTALGAVAACNDESITTEEILSYLKKFLPYYMLPTVITCVTTIPLTNNGKLDRLWAKEYFSSYTQDCNSITQSPKNTTDSIISLWKEVLNKESITHEDNFFASGGDSLKATIFCKKINTALAISIKVDILFMHPTLDAFTKAIAKINYEKSNENTQSYDVAISNKMALTPLQRAYLLGSSLLPGISCTMPLFKIIFSVFDDINITDILNAVHICIHEYAILHLKITEDAHQIINISIDMPQIHWIPQDQILEEYIRTYSPKDINEMFHLAADSKDNSRIAMSINYIALDAQSIMILLNQIMAIVAKKQKLSIDPSIEAFYRYIENIHNPMGDAIKHEEYSRIAPPEIPTIKKRHEWGKINENFHSFSAQISHNQVENLSRLSAQNHITTNALLLHFFGKAISYLTKQEKVGICVPHHYRPINNSDKHVLGNFTQIALCEAGEAISAEEIHHQLGLSISRKKIFNFDNQHQQQELYGVVFTSTLGTDWMRSCPTSIAVPWTLTQTPGVLLDCQIHCIDNRVEVRWDYPEKIVEVSAMAKAFDFFIELITNPTIDANIAADQTPDTPTSLVDIFHKIDRQKIRPSSWPAYTLFEKFSTISLEQHRIFHDVENWFYGELNPLSILNHPQISPEKLLYSCLTGTKIYSKLIEKIKNKSVIVLGAGSGTLMQLINTDLKNSTIDKSKNWQYIELNNLLSGLCEESGITPVPIDEIRPADVILCPFSLHRNNNLLKTIDYLSASELIILEIETLSFYAVISLLLDPQIGTENQKIFTAIQLWELLSEHNIHPSVLERENDLILIDCVLGNNQQQELKETREKLNHITCNKNNIYLSHKKSNIELDATKVVARKTAIYFHDLQQLWKKILNLQKIPHLNDNFFTLGGDSLHATKLLSALHSSGLTNCKLVNIFQYPTIKEFISFIVSAQNTNNDIEYSEISHETQQHELHNWYIPTKVQQAYTTGRDIHQLLGGVAAHCYWEFCIEEKKNFHRERFHKSIEKIIQRHPALRTYMIFDAHSQEHRCVVQEKLDEIPITYCPNVRSLLAEEIIDLSKKSSLHIGIQYNPDDSSEPVIIGISMDNTFLDGLSMITLLKELGHYYINDTALPEESISFQDYLSQKPHLSTWNMPKNPPIICPPLIYDHHVLLSLNEKPRFDRIGVNIENPQWEQIKNIAKEHGITPASLILAAYCTVLSSWSNTVDFTVLITTFERDYSYPAIENTLGDFTELALVYCHRKIDENIMDFAKRLQIVVADSKTLAPITALDMQRSLVHKTGKPELGLSPVVFTCGLGMNAESDLISDFGFGTTSYSCSQTPQTVIDLQVLQDRNGLHITADIVTQLIDTTTAEKYINDIRDSLVELIEHKDLLLAENQSNVLPMHVEEIPQRLSLLWQTILHLPKDKKPNNFFLDGGDSIKAIQLIKNIQDFSPTTTLRTLIMHPVYTDLLNEITKEFNLNEQCIEQGEL